MASIEKYQTSADVAAEAARSAITVLQQAIDTFGEARWVLAGGSSPMSAYKIIVNEYADSLDWSKVTAVIGDERAVAVDSPDSNWGQVTPLLFGTPQTSTVRGLRPVTELGAEIAATRYNEDLTGLVGATESAPRFDLVWLGVGEDGHTLSLFPGHPEFNEGDEALVVPIHNSPKPPPNRITLTTKALTNSKNAVIFATGAGKKDALALALSEKTLPIARVSAVLEAAGADVRWLFDEAAAG
ncbi:6-phosphogluconolactonase [Cryobacterium sp. SO2]|uniref:6-phosphogluconolactonase n=1 Tax=Cryobacterium sp. SO2 TaxID=1897060 RepID=UPI00223D03BA|nr:6-phosphogluconolactonase [Cryobacterium sp. SO2]WEO77509.1 6-phosphogluconolactonase [Cryobacterium sp. SO2]